MFSMEIARAHRVPPLFFFVCRFFLDTALTPATCVITSDTISITVLHSITSVVQSSWVFWSARCDMPSDVFVGWLPGWVAEDFGADLNKSGALSYQFQTSDIESACNAHSDWTDVHKHVCKLIKMIKMSHQAVPTTMTMADLERLGCTSESQSCTERLTKFASCRNFFDLFLACTGLADIIAWHSRAWRVGWVTSNLVSCLTLANKLLLQVLIQAIYCILCLLRTNMTDLITHNFFEDLGVSLSHPCIDISFFFSKHCYLFFL